MESVQASGAGAPTKRSWTVAMTAFRILASLEVLAILAQAATAGQFLGGNTAMRAVHGNGATVVLAVALLQLVAAVLVWRPGRGAWWPAMASVVVLGLGVVQMALGVSGNLALHVPNALVLLGLAVALTVWSWATRRP